MFAVVSFVCPSYASDYFAYHPLLSLQRSLNRHVVHLLHNSSISSCSVFGLKS